MTQIAITITQEIKDRNDVREPVGAIAVRQEYPNAWWGTQRIGGGYAKRTDLHETDGWYKVVNVNPAPNEVVGQLYFDPINNYFTYELIQLTPDEIKINKEIEAQSTKDSFIQQKAFGQIENELQLITDDNEALENKDGYSVWNTYTEGYEFPSNFKVLDFDDNLDLQLFKIITPHAKQFDRAPNETPALWTKIEFSGGIEVWSQPIGGDGKYPYLDPSTGLPYLVEYQGQIWQNDYQLGLNVWVPSEFGWILYTG